jgi:hypothetical protein
METCFSTHPAVPGSATRGEVVTIANIVVPAVAVAPVLAHEH